MKTAVLMMSAMALLGGCSMLPWGNNDQPAHGGMFSSPGGAESVASSRTTLDWWGEYRGVLPCADCEGIETYLRINKDSSYKLKTRYLGKSDRFFQEMGSFTWANNGTDIVLGNDPTKGARFRVADGRLLQTDMVGEPIASKASQQYELTQFRY